MNRRQMMITIGLLGIVAAAPLARAADSNRPNVIFFLTDDQRNDTLGCAGHPIIQTPTIDRLAAEGVRFENSFCEVPICASNRSTLPRDAQGTRHQDFLRTTGHLYKITTE